MFAFLLSLVSSWWRNDCHIINIMTISRGLSRKLSMVQLGVGDSQALCLLQVSNSQKGKSDRSGVG